MNLEDQIQQALRRAAAQDSDPGVRLGEVQGRARRVRARRRTSALAVAAAVVVVVGAPTALLVRDNGSSTPPPAHQGTPSPAPHPTSTPTPTPTATPTGHATAAPHTLASFPQGASTFISWADGNGIVHSNGQRSQLPGTMAPDVQFHELHGGWIVSGGETNTARVYDAQSKLTASGRAAGIVVTADRTRVAWMMGGKLYESGLSTMGIVPPTPSPDAAQVPPDASVIGYLPQGPALTDAGNDLLVVAGDHATKVPVGMLPLSTSQSAGLVGGVTGTPAQGDLAGAVYDVASHQQLWQSSWRPLRFSDDGTLVAAIPVADNGDPSSIAILDARTGKVITQTHDLGKGLFLGLTVAWDNHRLLFSGVGDHGKQAALLALDATGKISRVGNVTTAKQPGAAYVVFEAQP